MKRFVVMAFSLAGIMVSCNDATEEPVPQTDTATNAVLAQALDGGWIQVLDDDSDSFHQIDFRFEDNKLIWKDSTVTTQGKYAVIRTGSSEVMYLKNDPEVVRKYMMGRPPLTSGAEDILVSDWRGSKSINRNYRNVNKTKGWELINEWESGSAQPPMPDAVYALILSKSEIQLEYDGEKEDFIAVFSRPE